MIAWKAKVGDWISAGLSVLGPSGAPSGCRVLMYHAVGGEALDDAGHLYSIAPDRFAGHMRSLTGKFDVVSLAAGVATGRGLAITFDDGYRDNLTIAAPLLVEASLPFTVFVTTDFVADDRSHYLSRAELRHLASLPGATIGAHGRSHRRLTGCDDTELADELGGSRAWLEDLLGKPVTIMSYPHGAVDARVRGAVAKAGYQTAACSRFGTFRRGDDPLLIARTEIWAEDDTARLHSKAAGHWDWLRWRA